MIAPGTSDSRWYQGDPEKRKRRIIRAYQFHAIDDETLWRLLSGEHGPLQAADAADAYRSLGLVPFSGYSLSRAWQNCANAALKKVCEAMT